ncbi:Rrf2 family transcriptional regulator [Paenibacillus sp. sptzw28]|uniref:RrF2 family transcriptional regulator n=1 Tax=Paenibacillus sp. sptzw28 TaxID=715179 RepID=UPI001C6EDD88|nr:Rrf2 family transcriptional regulator [Paenibacillus sp. sptzw28]QYR21527.1 Rrf2 family transcriptional regulator [Paenibacillus sp. sptzw28]
MTLDKCSGNYHPKWFGLAVQALIILAKENIQTCPSVEIANYLQSEATLMRRVLAILAREGFLETREGRDGGYRLKKAPESINLVDVYSAFQVSSPLCFGIKDSTGTHTFGIEMKEVFSDITAEMDQSLREVLSRYTIADLVRRMSPKTF